MEHYSVRPATLNDTDILVRHRVGMFTDMGVVVDRSAADRFKNWLAEMMPDGTYRAWLLETETREVIAGGGITIPPWPPRPPAPGGPPAVVFNLYTQSSPRRHGHSR